MGNHVSPARVGQRVNKDGHIRGNVRLKGLGHGIETVPPQEKAVIPQGKAMLFWPGRSAETAQAVDKNYALFVHWTSLCEGCDITGGQRRMPG
ncbi:hypothetical protein NicSoilE8_23720 [Arthrobacter sp. NicSoilE8]|nr:hypothetical protein NicSoilE8_23720 [Arthrobacter sp. NicSoilE8]